ncbi:MAG: hypothetical protein ABFD00_07155 [Chloroherpetonaceae bacterium]
MAEVNNNASILIATSFQAIERAKVSSAPENLMISLVFLGFYLEENLDFIIETLNKKNELIKFFNKKNNHGLLDKFGWFYNSYIASERLQKSNKKFMRCLLKNLEERYPGFKKIYEYRNHVSHGKINSSVNIQKVGQLRQTAKAITDDLLEIVNQKESISIKKNINYKDAIANFEKMYTGL